MQMTTEHNEWKLFYWTDISYLLNLLLLMYAITGLEVFTMCIRAFSRELLP